jgi:EpsI family protein
VLVIAMMALALVGSVGFGRRGDPNAPNADLTVIPKQAQNWVMHQDQSDSLDKSVMSQIKADSYLLREYQNPRTGQAVQLMIVYRRYGRREFAHRPEQCYPASGFTIEKNGTMPLFWAGRDVPAVQITANSRDGEQSNLAYFFASGKKTESNFIRQQVWMALERLIPNKNGWTFIRLMSPTRTTVPDALASQQDFMRAMAPAIERAITTDGPPAMAAEPRNRAARL